MYPLTPLLSPSSEANASVDCPAVALSTAPRMELESLPPALLSPSSPAKSTQIPPEGINLEEVVNDFERTLLAEALRASDGVKKRAAQLVGVSFRSFRYRLEKLGLDRSDSDSDSDE